MSPYYLTFLKCHKQTKACKSVVLQVKFIVGGINGIYGGADVIQVTGDVARLGVEVFQTREECTL